MKGSKGTKMPRGDKKQMLTYKIVSNPAAQTIDFLQTALRQVSITGKESNRLVSLRDALLPKLMSGEIDVSKIDLTQLNSHLPNQWCVLLQIQGIPTYLPQLQPLSRKRVLEP